MLVWNILVTDTLRVDWVLWLVKGTDQVTWAKHLYIWRRLWVDEAEDIEHIVKLWAKHEDGGESIANRIQKW